ncbi:MAG: Bax inhibitor-1/YccA family protein [Gemmatimonadota bacterium]|nr:Bax inhibitor-1/YccA family protein [Gemmatimonadota bacterium]
MRSSNPALRDSTFSPDRIGAGDGVMTLEGAVNRTIILVGILLTTAVFGWSRAATGDPLAGGLVMIGSVGGLVLAIATIFKPRWSPVSAPLYAALEGLALGAISGLVNQRYDGLPMQAVALTAGTLFCLLLAYRSGLIRATENFRLGVTAATGAIALLYLVSMGMRFFGMQMPLLHEASPMGIGLSLFIVVIAALNLVLDFDFIEKGAEQGLPRYMEWYAGFGLLVTLVWLYLEILRLLMKLRSDD